MPADRNSNGDNFGGWITSQMDIAGGILAKETASSRVVTAAVDSIKFLEPVEVWFKQVRRNSEEEWPRFQATEALFAYVAIDGKGRKRAQKAADKAK
ncbi:MAG: hypothetical protein MUF27_06085 [Acidobacteria bacterium]|jgi:acyl-CoA thioesterase YciA|nr:hypothetical protein [Acidobacteriota bacterium]